MVWQSNSPFVTSTLNYIASGTKALRSQIIPDQTSEPLPYQAVAQNIYDARPELDRYSLDQEGLCFTSFEPDFTSYDDQQAIKTSYYKQAEQHVQHHTGAVKTLAFEHAVRRRLPGQESRSGYSLRRPLDYIHVDYTPRTAPALLKDVTGETQPDLRFEILNLWRPIQGPLVDMPLALCTANSVAEQDLCSWQRILPQKDSEMFLLHPNAQHRWVYLSQMRTHEAMLFRGYDSRNHPGRVVPHSAFSDPTTPAHCLARASIEVRLFAFFAP